MASALPVAASVPVSDRQEAGTKVSRLYTANLVGSALGAVFASAVLLGHYGVSLTVRLASGAAIAAAKLLNLNEDQIRRTLGIAASMSSGIRVNFGTMSKPLHVGRAAQNGTTAALLAQEGFSADMDALDGPWGYFQVFGGRSDDQKDDLW